MNGHNKIVLNQATMKKAMEYWLKTQVFRNDVEATVEEIEVMAPSGVTEFLIRFSVPEGDE